MTPATSSSAPSPNGETDMNDIDIDIEEGRRLAATATEGPWASVEDWYDGPLFGIVAHGTTCLLELDGETEPAQTSANAALIVYLRNNAAAMFDAIETGRQWETIARRLADDLLSARKQYGSTRAWRFDDALAAFRDLADRTPTPHHDGGVG